VTLLDVQRTVTKIGLQAARDFGFALAGSAALVEHGISDRPTDDADWFSTLENAGTFDAAVEAVLVALAEHGFNVEVRKRSATFFSFFATLTGGETVEVDMSLDWRRYHPAEIAIGPVLDIQDAAAAKVATIYSRGEARDFIDLWTIRRSGLWSDEDLFAMALDRDEGITQEQFTNSLGQIDRYDDKRFARYGLSDADVAGVRDAASDFADSIRGLHIESLTVPDHSGDVHVRAHARNGGTIRHYWRARPKRG
jgi:hypothetical protein